MWLSYSVLGLLAGTAAGFFGIGGGAVMVPAMVYLLGMSQHQAQGTTLAVMIPPIGILAAIKYYQQGNVNFGIAIFVCLGFVVGGLIGAQLAHKIPALILKRCFGVFLLLISLHMILDK